MEIIPVEDRGPISKAVVAAVEEVTGKTTHACHHQACVGSIVINTILGGDYSMPASAKVWFSRSMWDGSGPTPWGLWNFKGESLSGTFLHDFSVEHTYIVCWQSEPVDIVDFSLYQYETYFFDRWNLAWTWKRPYCWCPMERIPRAYQPFYVSDEPTTAKIMGSLSAEQNLITTMALRALRLLGRTEEPFRPVWWDEPTLDALIDGAHANPVEPETADIKYRIL